MTLTSHKQGATATLISLRLSGWRKNWPNLGAPQTANPRTKFGRGVRLSYTARSSLSKYGAAFGVWALAQALLMLFDEGVSNAEN